MSEKSSCRISGEDPSGRNVDLSLIFYFTLGKRRYILPCSERREQGRPGSACLLVESILATTQEEEASKVGLVQEPHRVSVRSIKMLLSYWLASLSGRTGWIVGCPSRVKERPRPSAQMVFLARVSGGCSALFWSEASRWRVGLDGVCSSVDSWYGFLGCRWRMARLQPAYWRWSESLQTCEDVIAWLDARSAFHPRGNAVGGTQPFLI
ncbi:hypothetical protein L7F22_023618 [Adiantum nelumboides]|nr:hypothetical protein [Adiantum nelumboides]